MRIESQLKHIDHNRVIAHVSAWEGDVALGSALGEGENSHLAEDNALQRLLTRLRANLEITNNYVKDNNPKGNDPIKSEIYTDEYRNHSKNNEKVKLGKEIEPKVLIAEEKADPLEWSIELAEVENHMIRLNWNRKVENEYLKKEFGICDRNRITKYDDILMYINKLRLIQETDPSNIKSEVRDIKQLLELSTNLINKLGWSTSKARSFLFDNMNVNTRQQLEYDELTKFNHLLKNQVDKMQSLQ